MGPLDLSALKRTHTRFVKAHNQAVLDEADDAAVFGLNHVKDHSKFTSRTGHLVRSTEKEVIRRGGRIIVKLKNKARYASAQDLGSGLYGPRRAKYEIRARRAKALRFIGHDGAVVFRRKVMHPGVRPTRFLYRATNAAGRVFYQDMLRKMQRLAQRF